MEKKPDLKIVSNRVPALVEHEGRRYAALKPICEELGLNWNSQRRTLYKKKELKDAIRRINISRNGKAHFMICLPEDALEIWLGNLKPNHYPEKTRQKILDWRKNGIPLAPVGGSRPEDQNPEPAVEVVDDDPPPQVPMLPEAGRALVTEFDGDKIDVIEYGGQFFVPMKPICEAIGLDWPSQRKLIERDPVLGSVMVVLTTTGTDGKTYPMLCLPIKFINGWLFKIDVSRYKGPMRSKLIRYQVECYDVLYERFCRRPGTTTDLVPREKIEEYEQALVEMKDKYEKLSAQVQDIKKTAQKESRRIEEQLEDQRQRTLKHIGSAFAAISRIQDTASELGTIHNNHQKMLTAFTHDLAKLKKELQVLKESVLDKPAPELPIKIVHHPETHIRCLVLEGQVMIVAQDFIRACGQSKGTPQLNLHSMGYIPGTHYVEISPEKLAAHYGIPTKKLQDKLGIPNDENIVLLTSHALSLVASNNPEFISFYRKKIVPHASNLLQHYLECTAARHSV